MTWTTELGRVITLTFGRYIRYDELTPLERTRAMRWIEADPFIAINNIVRTYSHLLEVL